MIDYNNIYLLGNSVEVVKIAIGNNIPFYIACGSNFSKLIHTNSNYKNIHLYFYNENDALTAKHIFSIAKDVCIYAKNILYKSKTESLQFIFFKTGTSLDILKGFDFNCSKSYITSDGDFYKSDGFSDVMIIDEDSVYHGTPQRYNKYLNKGVVDPLGSALNNILNYVIKNHNKKSLKECYNPELTNYMF